MNQEEINNKLWDAACAIESIESRLSGVACVLEIIAERTVTEAESGSLWLIRDTVKALADKLEDQTYALMGCMKAVKELNLTVTTKKGSKK
jgi:hypothetical protein